MDSSPIHRSNIKFLPTEIVHQILCSIESEIDDDGIDSRQSTLYACCLVSRQWYTEAIPMLYEEPFIDGSRFQQFAATVCPPLGTRLPKYKLGSLVHKLDMGRLVHQSSNSVTARLLGRVKKNLEEFTAPMFSFSEMSLLPLSKCAKLHNLDLFLIRSQLDATPVRKAISRLQNLRSLRLPNSDIIEVPVGEDTSWPPGLKILEFSGHLPQSPESITWPPCLKTLSLLHCVEIQSDPMCRLLGSLVSCGTLKNLIITESPGEVDEEGIASIPLILPNLIFLSVPGQYLDDSFFSTLFLAALAPSFSSPLPLKILQFGYSSEPPIEFSLRVFQDVLCGVLSNIRVIGFHEMWCGELGIVDEEELEDVLFATAVSRAKAAGKDRGKDGVPAISEQDMRDVDLEVYYFDDT